jgi:hypothetical protein
MKLTIARGWIAKYLRATSVAAAAGFARLSYLVRTAREVRALRYLENDVPHRRFALRAFAV